MRCRRRSDWSRSASSCCTQSAEPCHRLAGGALALVSDAGTPGVSDPGSLLVAAASEAGIRIVPVPGPSALLAALVASGLPTASVLFAGFLPPKTTARKKRLAALGASASTVVLYVPPHKLVAALEARKSPKWLRQGAANLSR